MADCLFCKIVAGQIPSKKLYEDDVVYAFQDIDPQAPLHALVVPREHIASLNELGAGHDAMAGAMLRCAATLAKEHGYAERGYRTVFNTNAGAGQSVFHIHLHVLAGRDLAWPPG
jgi:histidine triad (HIT) family protein